MLICGRALEAGPRGRRSPRGCPTCPPSQNTARAPYNEGSVFWCRLNKVMRFCFTLCAMVLAAFGLQAAPPTSDSPSRRVTTVVRADAGGRLVRSAVIASRTVPEKVILPTPPPQPPVPKAESGPSATVNALVDNIARRHNVEPSLVDSVIRVESNYNPNAVSSAGAMGLMQLIPSTAK